MVVTFLFSSFWFLAAVGFRATGEGGTVGSEGDDDDDDVH